ncbi:MAG: hypothetical protein S4CHLAM123_07300 [Chlamydiales bacterium]|nr:hypothetical protein [Chlamydiales bacterium]
MQIILNGESLETSSTYLSELIELQPGMAVAINSQIIPQKLWEKQILNPNDHIEVIIPFEGG